MVVPEPRRRKRDAVVIWRLHVSERSAFFFVMWQGQARVTLRRQAARGHHSPPGYRVPVERHYAPDKPLVWVGDLNVAPEPIDLHDPKGNKDHVDFHPLAREALARVREWGLVDVFRLHHPDEPEQYTYFDYRVRNAVERKVGWRVDHIYATQPLAERSLNAWIDVQARQAERPSDHTFLVAEFQL